MTSSRLDLSDLKQALRKAIPSELLTPGKVITEVPITEFVHKVFELNPGDVNKMDYLESLYSNAIQNPKLLDNLKKGPESPPNKVFGSIMSVLLAESGFVSNSASPEPSSRVSQQQQRLPPNPTTRGPQIQPPTRRPQQQQQQPSQQQHYLGPSDWFPESVVSFDEPDMYSPYTNPSESYSSPPFRFDNNERTANQPRAPTGRGGYRR